MEYISTSSTASQRPLTRKADGLEVLLSEDNGRELGLDRFMPGSTLDYYVKRRSGKKRNYVFDYGKSRTCDHPEMRLVARGGIVYRCLRCNYAFHIVGGYQQPLHNEVIQSAFNLLVFGKEFGLDSLGEVLKRPIGQHDSSPHKPVLPEGMSFMDVLELLEGVDVNADDGGAEQIYKLLDEVWVGSKERALADADAARQIEQLEEAATKKALMAGGVHGSEAEDKAGGSD